MQNNRFRTIARLIALILAALMLASTLFSALSVFVGAAATNEGDMHITTSNGASVSKLKYDNEYTITFTYIEDNLPIGAGKDSIFKANKYNANGVWDKSKASLSFKVRDQVPNSTTEWYVDITLSKIVYKSTTEKDLLELSDIKTTSTDTNAFIYDIDLLSISVPDIYFSGSSSGSSGDYEDPTTYTSSIQVENVIAYDSKDNRIDEITEDTPSFKLEIIYADTGLLNADTADIEHMQAFMLNGSSFEMKDSTRGTLRLLSDGMDYPRFRVTFTGVTYTGVGKEVDFNVFYKLKDSDQTIPGTGKGTLTAAKPKDGDDNKKMALPVPKIIISNYTYGNATIVAGSEFKLSFTLLNTSSLAALENIVVTMTPASNEAAEKGPGLLVASSSNTIYVPELAASSSRDYTIAFQARPDAEVTSHLINITFSYEYVDTNLETREKVSDLSESIAIPVSQIDRFTLEPVLDTIYAQVGEEAYLTVSFVNRGKSQTSNIYCTIRCDDPNISAPGQAYGHLEAGKPDTVDMYLTASEPGEYSGDIVVQYEDENGNTKELTTPFNLYVETPYYPDPMPEVPEIPAEPEPQGPGIINLVFFIIGGLAIAAPIMLYLVKRTKARAEEEFDEEF